MTDDPMQGGLSRAGSGRSAEQRASADLMATVLGISLMRVQANDAATRVRTDPDPTDPEWCAALDSLSAALDYLAIHDPVYSEALHAGEARRFAEEFQSGERQPGQFAGPGAEPLPFERALLRRIFPDQADSVLDTSGQPAPVSGQPVEGVIVEHNGTSRGCAPRHCTHPDVVAAHEALDGLLAAKLTDRHDISEPADDERDVRGWVADPRGDGRVAFYWLEGGQLQRRDDPWHGPCIDIVASRLAERGWRTEPAFKSSKCVFAHRPGSPAGE